MTGFLIAAALVLAATLILLSRPWWCRRRADADADADTRRSLNAAIYRDQRFSDHAPLILDYDYALGQDGPC